MNDEAQADATTLAQEVDAIITNHTLVAMGAGLIPAPLLDIVAVTGIQLNMIRKMAKLHAIDFNANLVKNLIGSLVGGGGAVPLARIFGSLVKIVPLVGPVVGALAMPISAGAVTYAVGKVFYTHFASGGTFLSFDPNKVKAHYAKLLKEGEEVASTAS